MRIKRDRGIYDIWADYYDDDGHNVYYISMGAIRVYMNRPGKVSTVIVMRVL